MTKWVVFMQNYEIRHFNKLFGDKLNPSFFTQNVNKVTALNKVTTWCKAKEKFILPIFIEHFFLNPIIMIQELI